MLEQSKGILELIANYGLPMVLVVWFVLRLNPTVTKLVNMLEVFIKWLTEKETERKEREKEMKEAIKTLTEQNAEVISRLRVLEVRTER
jgi:uncharacterized protein involved in cysteine biosynthesis